MSYSSLPAFKLFQLTSLSCALALAGCGGGDGGTDILPPKPPLGGSGTGGGDNNGGGNNNGGEQTPVEEPDFFLQKLTPNPPIIELTNEETVFTITVKAVQKATSAAMINKEVSLKVEGSETNGITIEGSSTALTDSEGNAVYKLKLNPQAVTDEAALLNNGFEIIATANKNSGEQVTQTNIVRVSKKGAGDGTQVIESELDISTSFTTSSVSNNILNVYGDTVTLSVIAKDNKGARVKDVKVGLGIANIKGVAIIGDNKKNTDANGVATFTIQVDDKLSAADRTALVDKTLAYAINIAETNGATKKVEGELKLALPVSDYAVSVTASPSRLSAYGDSQTIAINATAKNAKVPTTISGSTATIKLNDAMTGVSLSTNKVTLNAQGQANVTLNVADNLSVAERQALIEKGLSYTIVLTEPNRSATAKEASSTVYLPVAEYKINFNESNKKQLSSSGGSAVISFRVNDKRGGIIAGQKVTASLPKGLADAGLLTLQNNSEQTTDSNGEVSYTVRVPNNLTEAQKIQLEKAKAFVLTASMTEESGVPSSISSESIAIGSDIGQSDIRLTAQSSPVVVSVLSPQFKLKVAAKRQNGSAAVDRNVKLVLDEETSTGITIIGNELSTDSNGIAEFTIGINQNLTPDQREKLIKSGIRYIAVLTDNDGTQSKISQKVGVQQPATSIQFAPIASPSISKLGGSGNINVKLTTTGSNVKPVSNKEITIQLSAKAISYGVTVTQSAMTDFNGEAIFVANIPSTLTAAQRDDLESFGINYILSYIENGIKYDSELEKININTPDIVLNLLTISNQGFYKLNNVGDSKVIQAQLSNQTDKSLMGNQAVSLSFDNKVLSQLLIVNGQKGSANITADTDKNGVVSFDVVVPSNLTTDEKEALRGKSLTATLTESVTGKTQKVTVEVQSMTAAVSLSNTQSEPLNLNGGETQITVIAQDKDKNIVTGQKVFLALPASVASKGVTLVSGSQTTDNSGKAVFTIAVPNNLTDKQKTAIGSSINIALSAADASGSIVTQTSTVNTITPTGTTEELTIGANKVVNTKGDSFKVFVRVADDGRAINGRTVSLNVDEPVKTGVTVTNGTATTNSDGVAVFDLTLESGANVNQAILEKGINLTATTTTAENTKLVQNYIVAVDTATIDNYQILVTSDKSTLTTGGDQTNATFRVTDSNGGILAGVPVQLSIANLAASGAALTTPSMVTTDANGQINVGVLLAANSIDARLNHAVDIEAKIVTPVYDANGDITLTVRESKTLSLSAIGTRIDIEATATKLKDGEVTTISTTLIDGAGQEITNAPMLLIDENGKRIVAKDVLTDSKGVATFSVNEKALTFDTNGNLRVYARAKGETTRQDSITSIDLIKVSQAGISFIDIEAVYDVNKQQTINVQIRADSIQQAQDLIGETLEIQTTIGQLNNGNGNDNVILTRKIRATDIAANSNIITIPVRLRSELAGTSVLQARVLGVLSSGPNSELRYQTTVDTRFRATTPAKMLFQAVKSVITPGTSTEVVATVKDENDVPVEGQTVVFSRAADSSAGRLSAATAVTNSRGEARVVYQANASSPIGGVVINARLLKDDTNIGTKTTNITVSEEAVYTTLAFGSTLSSDDIYYTVQGSISVMDGSGRAVANKEVSIKSYATHYAQGKVCALDSTITYQAATTTNADTGEETTPAPVSFSEQSPILIKSNWIASEDNPEYNYTLDKDDDINGNGQLDAINPVAIIGGTLSDDGYTFVTDDEGRADFRIRYPKRYSNWVKVRFDATTFLNGSENLQSINYQLPTETGDISIDNSVLMSPWIDNTSPFGDGSATCVNTLSVNINENGPSTSVQLLSDSENQETYTVSINGQRKTDTGVNRPFYSVKFDEAFSLGSIVRVSSSGTSFTKVLNVK